MAPETGIRNGQITAGELFDYLRPEVEHMSRKLNHTEQVPRITAPGKSSQRPLLGRKK